MKRIAQKKALFIQLNGQTSTGQVVISEPIHVTNFARQISKWVYENNIQHANVLRLQSGTFVPTDNIFFSSDTLLWHNATTNQTIDITDLTPSPERVC